MFWILVRTPSADRDPDALAAGIANLSELALLAEKRLGDDSYLGGHHLTFADIILGHVLYRYYTLDFERAKTPMLDAYYKRLTERAAYAAHVMIDYSSLQVE